MANEQSLSKWRKKIILYSFMPSNAEEEAVRVNNTSRLKIPELVETGSPLIFDWKNPWKIKKKITPQILHQRNLVISYFETFEYILPYMTLNSGKLLVKGSVGLFRAWDVSNDIKFYGDTKFRFWKLTNHDDDYSLSFNVQGLGVGDEIGLCFNPEDQEFMFKVLSKLCRKKTFSYNFIPSRTEEEENNTSWVVTRELKETDPPRRIHLNNVRHMMKKITIEDLTFGELRIAFFATFEYILPYWNLELATSLVNGNMVRVGLWDVTEQNGRPNRYKGGSFTFRKLRNDDYSLSCMRLINDRGLAVGDEISLCWDPRCSKFRFSLLSKVCRKKTFSYNFIPSKTEEEVNNTSWVVTRELIETGPTLIIHSNKIMRKKITYENLVFGELRISIFVTFDCILPYWKLELARSLVKGNVVRVDLWDSTEKNGTKKYEDESITFRKLHNDNYSLSCMRLINDRELGVGDEIGLYWHPRFSKFIFKLICKVRDSIRPV
ncbi:uncharacterized protein LOC129877051 [Solanum dulcamara]|uniref:uncharacterized protein LOC129877051 n=1 Tax=Solanum dulcamara TaxID=45834 RepID=UPI0024856992|nr:uncharacterized protein LOC129877051 [Solanum dulcamara]